MIKYLMHSADWHKKPYHDEVKFNRAIDKFVNDMDSRYAHVPREEKLIVIPGDIFDNHDKERSNDAAAIIAEIILHKLKPIANVLITIGNHDYDVNNRGNLDCITPIMDILSYYGETGVTYLKETQCYVMENIVFCNYSNLEYNKRPEIEKARELHPNKTFVGLFHDIVNSSLNFANIDVSEQSSHSTDVEVFDGCDFVMMGDIHKHQVIDYKVPVVYCGSLFQINYGESVDGHGYCVWDVEDRSFKFHELDHDYKKYKLKITDFNDVDEDNIEYANVLNLKNLSFNETTEIKLEWTDYPINITPTKREILQKKVADKYKINKEAVSVIPSYIQIENEDDQGVSSTIIDTLFDRSKLKGIYQNYLEDNNITVDQEKFFELDNKVSKALNLSQNNEIKNRAYKFLWIKAENIFSYVDFYRSYENGCYVVKSNPGNAGGKSSLVRMPSILVFGDNVIYGHKKLKYVDIFNYNASGDQAYIKGEMLIEGSKYYIERKFKKSKRGTVKQESFRLYKYSEEGVYNEELGKKVIDLTVKNAIKSLNKFKKTIGSYSDYVFSSYYEHHNIEKWIETKPTARYRMFCDYLGLSILENKHKEAKEQYDEFLKSSFMMKYNREELIEDIESTKLEIQVKESSMVDIESSIENEEELIEDIESNIVKMYDKKHPVDSKFENFSLDDAKRLLIDYTNQLSETKTTIEQIKLSISDINDYLEDKSSIEDLNAAVEDLNAKYGQIQAPDELSTKIKALYNKLSDVSLPEEELTKVANIKSSIKDYEFELERIKVKGEELKSELNDLPNYITCVNCGNKEDTSERKSKMQEEISDLKNLYVSCQNKLKLAKIELKDQEQHNSKKLNSIKNDVKLQIEDQQKAIDLFIKNEQDLLNEEKSRLQTTIRKYDRLNTLKDSLKDKSSVIDHLNSSIKVTEDDIEDYNKSISFIEFNREVSEKIKGLNITKKESLLKLKELSDKLSDIKTEIALNKKDVFDKQTIVERIIEEIEEEEVFKGYLETHSNKGLSKQIILSVLPRMNTDLDEAMETVNFKLKIEFNRTKIEFFIIKNNGVKQPLYTGSGWEKTCSCLALHYVNTKLTNLPISNNLILDEVMGRVDPGNLPKVATMINKLSEIFPTIDVIMHMNSEKMGELLGNQITIIKKGNISQIV